jgi:hypothetical protein
MSEREFLIRVSYMEIYNEEINDLLVVESQKLQIHESLEVGYMPLDFILSVAVNVGVCVWNKCNNHVKDVLILFIWFPAGSICCRAERGNCQQC